ncbi:MAG: ATPase, T2SS/T4P/T4SS family [Bacteriovorax sp.]|nr:ATPase, T2SS/T4P/T4SS family [Bacteriovorax sp.]
MTNAIWNLIDDINKKAGITEILINDPKHVFVERSGQFIQINANLPVNDITEFIKDVAKMNQKLCDTDNPILDGNLPDGSRINIILEPFVQGSPAISIRKYLKSISSFENSPTAFGLNPKWIEFFKAMMLAKLNIVVSGGTSVGKTTFLNLLINEIAKSERVITIEDTIELSINLPNVVRLESGAKLLQTKSNLSTRDLVKNTLRMRPDRIIIGEVRGPELFDLLQAMNTGHEGSMTSVHANSGGECLSRMETLFLLAGFEIPLSVVRKQMASAINFIVQLGRDQNGQRVIEEIIEVCGMEGPTILLTTIATREDGALHFKGIAPKVFERLHNLGGLPYNFFENMN